MAFLRNLSKTEYFLPVAVSLAIGIVLIFLLIFCGAFIGRAKGAKGAKEASVCFKDKCFLAEVAGTEAQRTKGLMGRTWLDENRGMLFVFEREGIFSFWMKNTLIPLDIIWMNKDKEVVFIAKEVQPCKEKKCPSIDPQKTAQYVLELNAGVADKIGLLVGEKMDF